MDRRGFFQTIAAIGFATLPDGRRPKHLCEPELTEAWDELARKPLTFFVEEGGTLSIDGFSEPLTRADCMCLDPSAPGDVDGLVALAYSSSRAREVIAQSYLDFNELDDLTTSDVDDTDRESWIREDSGHLEFACSEIGSWLLDTDLDEFDYEYADRHSNTAQGAARIFWQWGGEELRCFDVVIVDGDCPGSSYYAAELHGSVEDANQLAIGKGIPVRFCNP